MTMNRYAPALNMKDGLTADQLKQFPAIFAEEAHRKMSDRYTFLSTSDVIRPLLKAGYIITLADQRNTRHGGRDPRYTRHTVRLRKASTKGRQELGDAFPAVQLVNSHDGQSRYHMYGGIDRLVCLNGMTISTMSFKGVSLTHRGDLGKMVEQIMEAVEQAATAFETVEKLAAKKLTEQAQKKFAAKAATLLWEEPDFDTAILLAPRREADQGDDGWRVYNRVQENLIRGGIQIQHTTGQARPATTRGITHIGRTVDVNLGLWELATKLVH